MPRMQSRQLKASLQRPKPLLKRLWEESQTKFLAYSQAASAGVLYGASQLHDALTSSTIGNALTEINLPRWFPWFILGLATLTYLAHGHGEDA